MNRKINRCKEIDDFLNKFGIDDKDAYLADQFHKKTSVHKRQKSKNKVKKTQHDFFSLDLHGQTLHDAEILLNEFIDSCLQKNIQEALIIFGKGKHSDSWGPKVGDLVMKKLRHEYSIYISNLEVPPERLGGEGAIIIYFK